MSASRRDRGVLSNRFGAKSRRRCRRQYALEPLESRVVLSYTFNYDPVTQIATATGTAATDSLVLEPLGGFLLHSVNGSPFDGTWFNGVTPVSVPLDPTLVVDVSLSTGDGSSLQLGTSTGPASDFGSATLSSTTPGGNASDTLLIDDNHGTTLASPIHPYSIDLNDGALDFAVSGPGFISQEPAGIFGGGVTLEGSPLNGDLYNVNSTFTGESVNVITGAGTTSNVNVAPSGLNATVAIYGASASSAATVNINDASDTTNATATLDTSGNSSAPYEVTGLSLADAPIEYGPGVPTLNIFGGTSGGGAAGVDFNVEDTQAGTTTTINGGAEANFYDLGATNQDLDNLPGPVVINGGGAGDSVEVDDFLNTFNDNYTVTSTTVTSTGLFGGLTYGGLGAGGVLNLYASSGSNVIDVDSTADGVNTGVSGEAGADTINVNGTGTDATLFVSTGDFTDDASTVNVLADSEPVSISSFASAPTVTTVNIGSTGGPGSMAGIQGPISVVNAIYLTSLNFHDENDTTGQDWTLDNDDTSDPPTGTVAVTGSATTTYNPADLIQMTVNGGSGGNTFIVNDTSGFYPTTLNTGTGDDYTQVYATGAGTLNINGQDGIDTVYLGGSSVAPWRAGTGGHHQCRQRRRPHQPGHRRLRGYCRPDRLVVQRRRQRVGHRPFTRHDQLQRRRRRRRQPDRLWRLGRQHLYRRRHPQ